MTAATARTGVYRGATKEEAERQYHAAARLAADDGFVPASEDWSVALGQQVLTVGYVYAPEQVPAILSALAAPPTAPVPQAAPATPAAVPASGSPQVSKRLIVGAVIVAVLGILAWQTGLLARLTAQGGAAGNIPPAGEIWFGTSFDPTTFAISGKTSSARVGSTPVMVAQLTRAVTSGQVNVRISWNGQVIANQNVSIQGTSGELLGSSIGPFQFAGTYLYELTDLGGNRLASGTLTVTE